MLNFLKPKASKDKAQNQGTLTTRIAYVVIGALVCALMGVGVGASFGSSPGFGGPLGFLNQNRHGEATDMATVVFERIVKKGELVSSSQNYCIVDKATDISTLFDIVEIPFSENSFWYRYEGVLKAGVNLEEATLSQDDTTINVSLKKPYIISNTPNMKTSGVLEEHNNILNPIRVEAVDEFQRQCVERSEQEAIAGGLLVEAQDNAEKNIEDMFYAALGEGYTVTFSWK